ncbi:class I SAM-dependent methyltransferase [Candidatus Woesearchaeota archaeon]|nr:class I SAM-dependent methyltransferase [Candidatus Woesearchaeota archaeon]
MKQTIDVETKFMESLLEFNYGVDVTSRLKQLAKKISWAKGWPEKKTSFWNAEAFMWDHKINKEKRELVRSELSFLSNNRSIKIQGTKERKNLDLGCGSYSYLPSVGFDISEKMLSFNENCRKKIQGDIEQPLPFKDEEFPSVTAVFVLNYVQNISSLLSEIYRVLKIDGYFVAVLSSKKLNDWQRQKEINSFQAKKWANITREAGFKLKFYEKENLLFLKCRKC